MKKYLIPLAWILLVSTDLAANDFHPPVPLLDENGARVMESGQPMSNMRTCGDCHDADFIAASSDHLAAGVFGEDEIQCLVCHADFEAPETWEGMPFEADGSLAAGTLDIHKPLDRNCACRPRGIHP